MSGVVSGDVRVVFTPYAEAGQCEIYVYTIIDFTCCGGHMEISFDPARREPTLRERKVDFTDAPKVFDGIDGRMTASIMARPG